MDSVEATLELHGLQMEFIKSEMKGFKEKVDRLEVKDREILGDFSKLDKKVTAIAISASSSLVPIAQTVKVLFFIYLLYALQSIRYQER